MQNLRRLIAVAAVAAITMTAGCGGGGEASPGSSSAPDEQAGKGEKLAMVGLYTNQYTEDMAAGAKAAADADGADFTQYGPVGLDPNKAINDFQNSVAAGATGVLAMAFPSELWTSPLDRAIGQGVTVVSADDYAEKSKVRSHVGPAKVAMGAALADEYIKQLPEDAKGTIVPGICVAGLPVLEAPLNGFRIRMEQERPGVKVIEPQFTAGDIPGNFAAWQRIQAKYSNALGFVGSCDQDVANMLKMRQAVKGDFLIGTTGGGIVPVVAKGIADGEMVGILNQRGWLQGYVGMLIIADQAFRDTEGPEGWLNTGYDVITKDNVEQQSKLAGDPAATKDYYQKLGDQLVADGAKLVRTPMTYELDPKSADEPNPTP